MTTTTEEEPYNYFTSQRLGYRTDDEIESLPTNAIDLQPRRDAYLSLTIFFVAVFVAITLDRVLPVNTANGIQPLDVFVIATGILGVLLYFPLLYFGWKCLREEHDLMLQVSSLEVARQEQFFPVQEEVFERSVRLVILRGLPITLVLGLFWESRFDRWGTIDWILLGTVLALYVSDLVCLEWYRRKALNTVGGFSAASRQQYEDRSVVSPSPLISVTIA